MSKFQLFVAIFAVYVIVAFSDCPIKKKKVEQKIEQYRKKCLNRGYPSTLGCKSSSGNMKAKALRECNEIERILQKCDFKCKVVIEDLGCWKDTGNRAIQPIEGKHNLLKDTYYSRTDAYEKCLKAALSSGYKVFAIQNGGWCASATNAEETYNKYGGSNACHADGEGGPWANQVYKIEFHDNDRDTRDWRDFSLSDRLNLAVNMEEEETYYVRFPCSDSIWFKLFLNGEDGQNSHIELYSKTRGNIYCNNAGDKSWWGGEVTYFNIYREWKCEDDRRFMIVEVEKTSDHVAIKNRGNVLYKKTFGSRDGNCYKRTETVSTQVWNYKGSLSLALSSSEE